jgi:hypothetical protein
MMCRLSTLLAGRGSSTYLDAETRESTGACGARVYVLYGFTSVSGWPGRSDVRVARSAFFAFAFVQQLRSAVIEVTAGGDTTEPRYQFTGWEGEHTWQT